MKARCKNCVYLNWDFITGKVITPEYNNFCGLHGRAEVDIDGVQQNLDGRGGCGYHPKQRQTSLFDLWGDF